MVSQGYHSAPTKLGWRHCQKLRRKVGGELLARAGLVGAHFFLMLSTALLRTPAFALQIHVLSK
jgi:hypothetical protein